MKQELIVNLFGVNSFAYWVSALIFGALGFVLYKWLTYNPHKKRESPDVFSWNYWFQNNYSDMIGGAPTTIGTLYLSLPPSPIDGTFITAKFSEQINTANWIVTDGSTVKGLNNGGLILAGIEIKLYYDLATTTWY